MFEGELFSEIFFHPSAILRLCTLLHHAISEPVVESAGKLFCSKVCSSFSQFTVLADASVFYSELTCIPSWQLFCKTRKIEIDFSQFPFSLASCTYSVLINKTAAMLENLFHVCGFWSRCTCIAMNLQSLTGDLGCDTSGTNIRLCSCLVFPSAS